MRQFLVFLFFALLVIIPFLIWGEALMQQFTLEASVQWLKRYGAWAWLAGLLLMVSDLVLPIPGTLVMSALGYVYGPWWGSFLAVFGTFSSGAIGYWLSKLLGIRFAEKILGSKGLLQGKQTFDRIGGWLVVLSRWLPVFPEVIACMAGLNQMSARKFHLALLVSSVPIGILFAMIGHAGAAYPTAAILLSALLPPTIWLAVRPFFERQRRR